MSRFASIEIPRAPRYLLRQARVPACLLAAPPAGLEPDTDGALLLDLEIVDAKLGAIAPSRPGAQDVIPAVDLAARHVWPTLVDVHAHLDKCHIIDRTQNPAGDFAGARDGTSADRVRYWSADDVRRRMDFGLRCAEAHGVTAIRTHLDSHEGQGDTSWAVFREMRQVWRGRIELQGVGLIPIDMFRGRYGDHLADVIAQSGGILGGVTRVSGGVHGEAPADIDTLIDRVFTLAAARNLDIDLHVDEAGDPAAASLWNVAQATLRHGYEGRVTCGHCCSLAVQDPEQAARTIALVAQARISVVTLPTVNMYLQDRVPGRTPRWRGVTMVKELRQAGVRVAVAGDNCRDPFYAYGDHDMLDTFRQAVRMLHLDHPYGDAPSLVSRLPAAMMGIDHGVLRTGAPANLILCNARSMNELIARPQSDRIVIRDGRRLLCELPDYEELAFVMAAPDRSAMSPLAGSVAAE
jgi:cytosine deaminase